jgi:hypothetical protein
MRDRTEQILRLLCLALVVLVLAQLIRAGFRANPLARAQLPPVPTLQTNGVTNAVVTTSKPSMPATGIGSSPRSSTVAAITTFVPRAMTNGAGATSTNNILISSTNAVAGAERTNQPTAGGRLSPNPVALAMAITNLPGVKTNVTTALKHSNSLVTTTHPATNSTTGDARVLAATQQAGAGLTNHSATNMIHKPGAGLPGGFAGMPGMPGAAVALPKDIQARVDKIVDSEIFAPVMRPQPMQLFGIAGNTAFLRTDSGQSGLVKEGDSLGDVKLLRIGINRVLVEEEGEKKELMIFDGYGGESLMPK